MAVSEQGWAVRRFASRVPVSPRRSWPRCVECHERIRPGRVVVHLALERNGHRQAAVTCWAHRGWRPETSDEEGVVLERVVLERIEMYEGVEAAGMATLGALVALKTVEALIEDGHDAAESIRAVAKVERRLLGVFEGLGAEVRT
jgi:hypothetical protein